MTSVNVLATRRGPTVSVRVKKVSKSRLAVKATPPSAMKSVLRQLGVDPELAKGDKEQVDPTRLGTRRAAKKSTAKKSTAKKSTAKKSTAKKSTAKKSTPTTRKSTASATRNRTRSR
jgi:trigger factor